MTDCYCMNGAGSVQELTIRKSYELSTRRETINTVFFYDKHIPNQTFTNIMITPSLKIKQI